MHVISARVSVWVFRVGFQRDSTQLKPATANMTPSRHYQLADELSCGRILGQFPLSWYISPANLVSYQRATTQGIKLRLITLR